MPAVAAALLNGEAVGVTVRPWLQAVDGLGKKLANAFEGRLTPAND
ncbi:hypothetical protein ABZ403_20170 [Micromonospora zamorensis]